MIEMWISTSGQRVKNMLNIRLVQPNFMFYKKWQCNEHNFPSPSSHQASSSAVLKIIIYYHNNLMLMVITFLWMVELPWYAKACCQVKSKLCTGPCLLARAFWKVPPRRGSDDKWFYYTKIYPLAPCWWACSIGVFWDNLLNLKGQSLKGWSVLFFPKYIFINWMEDLWFCPIILSFENI